MTKFTHSPVLFLDSDLDPMKFYMRSCPSRSHLKDLVEYGGGTFVTCASSDAIRLIEPKTKVLNFRKNEIVVSSQYIHDCVKRNMVLDFGEYIIEANSMAVSDIFSGTVTQTTASKEPDSNLSVDYKIIKFVVRFKSNLLEMSDADFSEKLKKFEIYSITTKQGFCDYMHKIREKIDSYNVTSEEKNIFKIVSTQKYSDFTLSEELKILQFIIINDLYDKMDQNDCFQEMEEKRITHHSWKTMKRHFHHFMLNNIQNYCLPSDCLQKITGLGTKTSKDCVQNTQNEFVSKTQKKRPLETKSGNNLKKTKVDKKCEWKSTHATKQLKKDRQASSFIPMSKVISNGETSGAPNIKQSKVMQNNDHQKHSNISTDESAFISPVKTCRKTVSKHISKQVESNSCLKDFQSEMSRHDRNKRKRFRFYNPEQYSLSLESTVPDIVSQFPIETVDENVNNNVIPEPSESNIHHGSFYQINMTPKIVDVLSISHDENIDICGIQSCPSSPGLLDNFDSSLLQNLGKPSEMIITNSPKEHLDIFDGLTELQQIKQQVQQFQLFEEENDDDIAPKNLTAIEQFLDDNVVLPSQEITIQSSAEVNSKFLNIEAIQAWLSNSQQESLLSQPSEESVPILGTFDSHNKEVHFQDAVTSDHAYVASKMNESFLRSIVLGEEDNTSEKSTSSVHHVNEYASETSMNVNIGSHDADITSDRSTTPSLTNAAGIPSTSQDDKPCSQDNQSVFLAEAAMIVQQLETMVSNPNGTQVSTNSLKSGISKLKTDLYKMLLSNQVGDILKKPKLSISDVTLLVKYVSHVSQTKPEVVLQNIVNCS